MLNSNPCHLGWWSASHHFFRPRLGVADQPEAFVQRQQVTLPSGAAYDDALHLRRKIWKQQPTNQPIETNSDNHQMIYHLAHVTFKKYDDPFNLVWSQIAIKAVVSAWLVLNILTIKCVLSLV